MEGIELTLKEISNIPIEADNITPENLLEKDLNQIEKIPLWFGNRKISLGEVFSVKKQGHEQIVFKGDLSRVKHIGQAMKRGKILIEGNAGMHLGAYMKGGLIEVRGDVGDWTGAEMTGGIIRIKGDVGHLAGAAYRGSKYGMNKGMIIVEGNAGNEIGLMMRRGLIVVLGNTGDFAGASLKAGTIIVFGKIGKGVGGGMNRGTILCFQTPEILPTFQENGVYNLIFLRLLFRFLAEQSIEIPKAYYEGLYHRYNGDLAEELSKGEVLVYDQY